MAKRGSGRPPRYTPPVRPFPPSLTAGLERDGEGLRILIVRLGAFGDVVRTVPAVRLLRRRLPRARIEWIVDRGWLAALDGHPDLDGVLAFPRKELRPGGPGGLRGALATARTLRRELRGRRYDLALEFQGNLRGGATAFLAGAPVRLGYGGHLQREGNRLLTTHRVAAGARRTHRMARNLALVAPLGAGLDVADPAAPGALPPCALPLVERGRGPARAALDRLELEPGAYAVVAPGASARQAYKRPPAGLLAAAARAAARRGLAPLVVWGPGEEPDAREVCARAPGEARLAPPTTLPELAGLIEAAALFVGGDSGPLHLACATGTPAVAVYGPTDPAVNAPWNVPHEIVRPDGAVYRGIKRRDRRNGFSGLDDEAGARAVDRLLADQPA